MRRLPLLKEHLGPRLVLLGEAHRDLHRLAVPDRLRLVGPPHGVRGSSQLGGPPGLQSLDPAFHLRQARLGVHELFAHGGDQPLDVLLGGAAEAVLQAGQRVIEGLT